MSTRGRSGRDEYLAAHIPGARFLDIDVISDRSHPAPHMLPSADEFGAAMEATDATGTSPERLMLSTEVQERIGDAMSGLSRMERAAFVLRHFEGRSIDEISQSLGLKTNATKHSIFRAVKKMRSALEPLVSATEPDRGFVPVRDRVIGDE